MSRAGPTWPKAPSFERLRKPDSIKVHSQIWEEMLLVSELEAAAIYTATYLKEMDGFFPQGTCFEAPNGSLH